MFFLAIVLLLAAQTPSIIAGPVPHHDRRQLFASFANTTLITQPTLRTVLESSATTASIVTSIGGDSLPPTSSSLPSFSTAQQVNANTALVIEPIQKTIITQINSAITFLNPQGEPIASQPAETILITSYFTPTPAPAASSSTTKISNTPPTPSPSSSNIDTSSTLSTLSPSPSQVSSLNDASSLQSSSTLAPAIPASSVAAVESGALNATSIPSFSYTPQESLSIPLAGSPTPLITSKAPAGNATGLPGFFHPSPVSRTASAANPLLSSTAVDSSVIASSFAPSSSATPVPQTPSSNTLPLEGVQSTTLTNSIGTKSRVVVTKTLYTTVFPSSATAQSPIPVPTPSQGSELVAITTPVQTPLSRLSASPPAAASPSPTLLAPPPVVVVTQYTTVAPSSTIQPSQLPEISNTPVVPVPSPSQTVQSSASTQPSSSIMEAPSPASSEATPPSPSSKLPEAPANPSSSVVSSPSSAVLSSTTPAAQPPPSPPPAPPAVSSTTSDGPLVITPIAPSQIFTVTVTTTEKETVTETATVSVTVRA